MKRILLALALIIFTQPALADTWTVGQQAFTFVKTGTNVVGDGTTSQGGIAPAYENGSNPFEPADIADNWTQSGSYLTTAQTRCTYPTGNAAGAVNCTSTAAEAKFRTLCNFGFVGQFDPIVFPGQPVAGHLHQFSGNLAVAYNSTYSQLRQNGESTCAGNKNNRSAYWSPAMLIDLLTGYSAVFKFKSQTVYYTLNPASRYVNASRIPRDFAYIGGYDPADPNNTKLTIPMATGNTAGCTGGGCRYSLPSGIGLGTSSATGFEGWECLDSGGNTTDGHTVNAPINGPVQPYLRNASGQATLVCPSNGSLLAVLDMPDCWDGKNLHSGGSVGGGVGGVNLPSSSGRLHVSYRVHDNNTGQDVCPTGTWQIPVFLTKYIWALSGLTDVSKLYLSSDVMNYGAPDPTSRSPCRQVSSHYCYGETLHNDWYGAWGYGTAASPGIMLRWMNHGNGVQIIDSTGTMASDPAEEDTSTIDKDNALQISGTTTDGHPFGNPSVNYTGTARYVPVVPGSTGNAHMHHGVPCTTSTPCQMPMNDNMPMPANDNQLAGVVPVSFSLKGL